MSYRTNIRLTQPGTDDLWLAPQTSPTMFVASQEDAWRFQSSWQAELHLNRLTSAGAILFPRWTAEIVAYARPHVTHTPTKHENTQ